MLSISRPPGEFKQEMGEPLAGTGTLDIRAGSDMTEIRVTDASFRKVAIPVGNSGSLKVELPAGIYQVSFRDGLQWKVIPPTPLWPGQTVAVEQPDKAEAIVSDESEDVAERAAASIAEITVVVGDAPTSQQQEANRDRLTGISLLPANSTVAAAELKRTEGKRSSRLCWTASAGWYRLRFESSRKTFLEMPIAVCLGWQTRITMKMAQASGDIERADPTTTRVRMAPPGQLSQSNQDRRLEENALESLAVNRRLHGTRFNQMLESLLGQKFVNPMLGILGGHLLPCQNDEEIKLLQVVVDNLDRLTRSGDFRHPDVRALALRSAMLKGALIDSTPMLEPPMLRASWECVLAASRLEPRLIPAGSISDLVGRRLCTSNPFLIWSWPKSGLVAKPRSKTYSVRPMERGVGIDPSALLQEDASESLPGPSGGHLPNDEEAVRACALINAGLHHAALREWFRSARLESSQVSLAHAIHPIADDETRQQSLDHLRLKTLPGTSGDAPWSVARLSSTLDLPAGTAFNVALDLADDLTEQASKLNLNLLARTSMARPEPIKPYDPNFLGDGFAAPLPSLSPSLRASAFDDGAVIDYTHYSLVMHLPRRVAIYTAHNVDAARAVRGISGGLSWKMDERVGENQLGPEVYSNNQLDRGHLVRRQDVLWGSVADARHANRNTYFYTNAAPLHQNFNQDEWVHLEDWVLHQATDFSYRLCVFTGPVLRPDDPTLNDLPPNLRTAFRAAGPARIPAAFWKVVILRDAQAGGDDLSAVAFAMKQSEMWTDREGSRLINLRVHQVTLRAIEEWTGLDFGALRDVDELEWSERLARTRELGQVDAWPVVRSESDLVFSGAARRARGLRASRSAVPSTRSSAMPRGADLADQSRCGCGAGQDFNSERAIELLSRDVGKLTSALAAMKSPPPAPGGRIAQPQGPTSDEAKADSIAASVPNDMKQKVRDFMLQLATRRKIDQGTISAITPEEVTRIVGGDVVLPGDFPSCCCIGDANGWFCTGALVAPTVVLTAAHCGRDITRIMVGGNSVAPFDQGARSVAVRGVHIHPSYRGAPHHSNDLTVLLLDAPANAAFVPLATAAQLQTANVDLVGFGYNDPMRPLGFGTKRRVTVPMGPIRHGDDTDLGQLPTVLGFHPEYEFVAGRKGLGRDSCNGDSGGPAYVADGNGRFVLAGLTSRATREAVVNCGDGGIYVRPEKFRAWINEVLASAGLSSV